MLLKLQTVLHDNTVLYILFQQNQPNLYAAYVNKYNFRRVTR